MAKTPKADEAKRELKGKLKALLGGKAEPKSVMEAPPGVEPIDVKPKQQRANAPKSVASVFDDAKTYDEALALAKAGKHLKIDPETGKYIGLGEHITSPQALGALRGRVDDLVREGAYNADWYLRQQDLARSLSDNPTAQSLFARGTAAYSPQAMPKVELPSFLRQHNEKMLTGLDTVARTGSQMRNVAQAYTENPITGEMMIAPGSIRLGKKTGPYAEKKDPTVGGGFRTANDIWHARAFELGKPGELFTRGLTPQEHGALTGENLLLADRATRNGVPVGTHVGATHDPSTAQAATWGAVRFRALKAEDEARFARETERREAFEKDPDAWRKANPKKSPPSKPAPLRSDEEIRAYAMQGLDTAFPNQSFYLTKEAVPGRGLGHLEGMIDAPESARRAYTEQHMAAMGRDPTIEGLGLYSTPPTRTQGEYTNTLGEVERNPGWQNQVAVSNVKGPLGRETPGSEREALDLAAQIDAIMGAQQSTAGSRFHPAGTPGLRVRDTNALGVETSGMTPDDISQIRNWSQGQGYDVVDYGPRMAITQFGDEGPKAGTGTAMAKAAGNAPVPMDVQRGRLETIYQPGMMKYDEASKSMIPTPPGSGETTQRLLQTMDESQIRNLYQRLDASRWPSVAKAKNDIDEAISESTSMPVRTDLMKLRQIIAEGGFSGLKEYVKRFGASGLPALGFLDLSRLVPEQDRALPEENQ